MLVVIAPLQLARSIAEPWPPRRIPERELIDLSRYRVQQPAWAIRGDALDRCRIWTAGVLDVLVPQDVEVADIDVGARQAEATKYKFGGGKWLCRKSRSHDECRRAHRAKLNAPTRIIAAPANLPLTSPVAIVFSSSTKMAIAAIHRRFITPPTNSNPIRIQQQPTQ
jgi:hypothetical protein